MDWLALFREHRIEYETTKRGWVNIQCPFCGDADTGKRMGVYRRFWSCWRNVRHRGSDPAVLVQKLLSVSYEEAKRLCRSEHALPTDSELVSSLRSKLGEKTTRVVRRPLDLKSQGFRSLASTSPFAKPLRHYLQARGYRGRSLDWLIDTYDLQYCIKGPFQGRVVFPVYDRDGTLVSWTGRSVRADDKVRYRTLSMRAESDDEPVALLPTSKTLLNLPLLWRCENPRVLVVGEGPFDATRITCFGRTLGVYATCLFGLSMSGEQQSLLMALRSRFDAVVVLLDAAAQFQAFRMSVSGAGFLTHRLDERYGGYKDPGEMPGEAVVSLSVDLLRLTSTRSGV